MKSWLCENSVLDEDARISHWRRMPVSRLAQDPRIAAPRGSGRGSTLGVSCGVARQDAARDNDHGCRLEPAIKTVGEEYKRAIDCG